MSAEPERAGVGSLACGLVTATSVALWLVWPAFSPGHIINLDAPRHLLRTMVMAGQFLPSGHVDGWSPWWYLGAQLFLFQSYGYFLAIGASALLLEHVFALETVFKVWYALPILALPAATGLMALRLGVARRGAVAAALASLVFSSSLGYGIVGVFAVGLLLQGAGIVGFALVWPEILGVLLHRERAPWRAVLALAALLLVHFITGAYALAASGAVAAAVALRSRDPGPVLRYALVAALVLLLAGHALFPSLERHDLAGAVVGWGVDLGRFERFLNGTLFGARPLALASLAAAAWSIWRGNRPLAISAIVFFATGVLGGSNEQGWEPARLEKIIEIMVRPRALPYAALFQAVFAGVAADACLRAVEIAAARMGRPALAKPVIAVAAAAALLVAMPVLRDQRRFVRTESMLQPRDHRVYTRLVQWLRANVEPPAILAVPRTLLPQRVIGARSVVSLLNIDTGLYTLGGDQAELSRSTRHSERVDLERIDEGRAHNAAVLRAAGVSYLIVSHASLRQGLAGSPDFKLVFEYDLPERRRDRVHDDDKAAEPLGVAVYRLVGGGIWLHGPGLEVLAMHHAPERISWDVRVSEGRSSRAVSAAVNWHPDWTASVDGVPVATRCSPARRVSLDLPPGATHVTLEFERSLREKAWNALSAATLLFVLAAWAREMRARRMRLRGTTPARGRAQST